MVSSLLLCWLDLWIRTAKYTSCRFYRRIRPFHPFSSVVPMLRTLAHTARTSHVSVSHSQLLTLSVNCHTRVIFDRCCGCSGPSSVRIQFTVIWFVTRWSVSVLQALCLLLHVSYSLYAQACLFSDLVLPISVTFHTHEPCIHSSTYWFPSICRCTKVKRTFL